MKPTYQSPIIADAQETFSRDLARATSLVEAVLMQRFCNALRQYQWGMWAPIPAKLLCGSGISYNQFSRVLKKWKELRLVHVRRVGFPPITEYLVNGFVLGDYLIEQRVKAVIDDMENMEL